MKIGIDAREAAHLTSGKGCYTWNVIKALLEIDGRNNYLLYTKSPLANFKLSKNAEIKIIEGSSIFWHLRVLQDWMERSRRSAENIFFAPTSFIVPAFLPRGMRSVLTVHDLVAFLHPQMHQRKATFLEKIFAAPAIKKARRILVPSKNTRGDVEKIFHGAAEKIKVTPLAPDEIFLIPHNAPTVNVREKYILTVSGLEPRKNVTALVEAFEKIASSNTDLHLIIVGGKGWKSQALAEKIEKLSPRVRHLSDFPTSDLPALYAGAFAFIYPSLYEGFGLPPLEAMASGAPVICSDTSSLPEVCGEAALYINPKNSDEIAVAIQKLLADEELRMRLIGRGRMQAAEFSWKITAHKTLAAFEEAAKA